MWVTVLAVLIGTANAFLIERTQFRGKTALSLLMLAPLVIPGVILGALLLAGLPELLRHVAHPLTAMTDGRLAPEILRQLLIALAMIIVMLLRPKGLWPAPEHGKSLNK